MAGLRKKQPKVQESFFEVEGVCPEVKDKLIKAFGEQPDYRSSIHSMVLNVPYKEKDVVKTMGAKWAPELGFWYVPKAIVKEKAASFIPWVIDRSFLRKID